MDAKRSNAINIGLTTLPKPDAIKTAIMKLDNSVINREGIEVYLHSLTTFSTCIYFDCTN